LAELERMVMRFRTVRGDVLPNLDRVRIESAVLHVARADGMTEEVPVAGLHNTRAVAQGPGDGLAAPTVDGTISTQGGGAGWRSILGRSPIGYLAPQPVRPPVDETFVDHRHASHLNPATGPRGRGPPYRGPVGARGDLPAVRGQHPADRLDHEHLRLAP
jgi:hypothetical protein